MLGATYFSVAIICYSPNEFIKLCCITILATLVPVVSCTLYDIYILFLRLWDFLPSVAPARSEGLLVMFLPCIPPWGIALLPWGYASNRRILLRLDLVILISQWQLKVRQRLFHHRQCNSRDFLSYARHEVDKIRRRVCLLNGSNSCSVQKVIYCSTTALWIINWVTFGIFIVSLLSILMFLVPSGKSWMTWPLVIKSKKWSTSIGSTRSLGRPELTGAEAPLPNCSLCFFAWVTWCLVSSGINYCSHLNGSILGITLRTCLLSPGSNSSL